MENNHRKYNFADVKLVELGSVMIEFLVDDLEDFKGKDATYNQEKFSKIVASQKAAEGVRSDDIVVADQVEVTAQINSMMVEAGKMHNEMLYFAKKIFGPKSTQLKEFGVSRFQKLKNSQPKLISYMEKLAQNVITNRDGLIEKGALDARLEEVINFSKIFKDLNLKQESLKNNRAVSSIDRVRTYNTLFDNLKEIKEVAKMIYPVGSAKLKRYQFNNQAKPLSKISDILEINIEVEETDN